MTKKVYRTANGKLVDIGALMLQNEDVRAVGNMNVNARGDLVDGQNRTIDSKNRRVAKQYNRQTTNVSDQPVAKNRKAALGSQADVQPTAQPAVSAKPVSTPAPVQSTEPVVEAGQGGLAAAIARARSITQEPLTPPVKKSSDGISKI